MGVEHRPPIGARARRQIPEREQRGEEDMVRLVIAAPPVVDHRVERTQRRHMMPPVTRQEQRIAGLEQRDARRSEEHTSELQSLMRISYAVFCLKKKTKHSLKQHNAIKPT